MIVHICVTFRCSRSKAYQNSFSAGVTQLAQSSIFWPKSLLSQNKKNQIRISCDSAHVLSMSTLIIKLHGILLEFFRGVAVTICFICVFKFAQTSKLKRGKIHRNIVKSEIPHSKCTTIQYTLIICNVSRDSVEQFQRGGDDKYFMWVKFLHSKRRNSQINWIRNSANIAHLCSMSFITTKFHEV